MGKTIDTRELMALAKLNLLDHATVMGCGATICDIVQKLCDLCTPVDGHSKTDVLHAAKVLREWCKANIGECEDCPLSTGWLHCGLKNDSFPAEWVLPGDKKEGKHGKAD